MSRPRSKNRLAGMITALLALTNIQGTYASPSIPGDSVSLNDSRAKQMLLEDRARLNRGEVVVGWKTDGETRFVTGRVIIDQPPDLVWPIMVNPFEFQKNISSRMKKVDVLKDTINNSVLKVTMDVFPIPDVTYLVESSYSKTGKGARVDFKRVGGILKDFQGYWQIDSYDNGRKSELTYSMYIDPGFFVPQWIVRKGVRGELPKTLKALRDRVETVCADSNKLEKRTILAAIPLQQH